jgi:hypothetical protein
MGTFTSDIGITLACVVVQIASHILSNVLCLLCYCVEYLPFLPARYEQNPLFLPIIYFAHLKYPISFSDSFHLLHIVFSAFGWFPFKHNIFYLTPIA